MAQFLLIGDPNDLHTRWRIEFLRQRGHHVELLCEKNEMSRCIEREGLLPWIHAEALPYFSWKNLIQRKRGAQLIGRRLRETGAQALLILYGEPHAGWAYYQGQWKIPIALHTYGTDALVTLPRITTEGIFAPLRKRLFQHAFEGLQLHLASSRKQFEMLEHLSHPRLKKKLIRIGLQSKSLDTFRAQQQQAPHDQPYVLFPRLMHPIYNHTNCLDAIALLPEEVRRKFTFVFVDADSRHTPYTAVVRTKMELLHHTTIVWLPRLTAQTLWNWIAHARLCVQVPATDASAITALETLYLGTPLLLGPAAYDDDLYSDVPRTTLSPEDIARHMQHLLQHPVESPISQATLQSLTDCEEQGMVLEKCLLTMIMEHEHHA